MQAVAGQTVAESLAAPALQGRPAILLLARLASAGLVSPIRLVREPLIAVQTIAGILVGVVFQAMNAPALLRLARVVK